ncbi:MAG: 4Fe-4S dicluster domain-containing protein [Chloroflexi bacterium]|nr:4Fe-4S dicluster domain-containing protein [Chloroflexota bacterium]
MTRRPRQDSGTTDVIERQDFTVLFDALAERGYRLVGPTVREGVVVYDDITSSAELPVGYVDEQEKGTYRLIPGAGQALFGCGMGPHTWKKYLFPPKLRLWGAECTNGTFALTSTPADPADAQPLALIGVRACELAAIAIQDRILMGGDAIDPHYKARREHLFIVAVNCVHPENTCFCASMNTGPRVASGFDLSLTEVIEPERHFFVVQSGSDAGAAVLASVPHHSATREEKDAADTLIAQAAEQMGRNVNTKGLKELLARSTESPHWDAIAARCLACGNCTMVCPTCFCMTVEDTTDLSGEHAERWRMWDSCFTTDFSYVIGGSVRPSVKSRYRQWLTHKFSTWIDQFGMSGCVGCGRCITWCPAEIDITEEVRALQAQSTAEGDGTGRKRKDAHA